MSTPSPSWEVCGCWRGPASVWGQEKGQGREPGEGACWRRGRKVRLIVNFPTGCLGNGDFWWGWGLERPPEQ